MMLGNGLNAIRSYTVPPLWLLDLAETHGLKVMVGLPWEQHVTFLDQPEVRRRIVRAVREGVRRCAGHPALLCYIIGNEIPAPIVRWHGHRRIERFIERLYRVAKQEDPETLVSYVSYPTTEYLELPFLDFVNFNVFLEEEDKLSSYLARLQNQAGERPLLMAETGLDSLRNGEENQAATLAWQIRASFASACAGLFVFSWSDQWHRGGQQITDWAFGLTDTEGNAKPALLAVKTAFGAGLVPPGGVWPFVTVVVCTYNGSKHIRQCLDGIERIDYPSFEVLVINDGSTDETRSIVSEYQARNPLIELIDMPQNVGLSAARNEGMKRARGEVVAYIDDDAWPDPAWLSHLACSFLSSKHVGIGGPNIAPLESSLVADCVGHSPGGPSHVLHSDFEAEHLPGCNMAFRREAIMAIDGFDTRFRIAGDDVDLCWRLQEQGGTLGFSPGAMVWHHRRDSVRGYLKQQFNYGRAEGMLELKWPGKYNRLGHMRWAGRLYGKGHTLPMKPFGKRIDHGVWGSRLFQSMYATNGGSLWSLTLMPEWYLVVAALFWFSVLGILWKPLFFVLPLLFLAVLVPSMQVLFSAARARFDGKRRSMVARALQRLLTTCLHILQPLARLTGRISNKLTPWRLHGSGGFDIPIVRSYSHWSETWKPATQWLEGLEKKLMAYRVLVRRGGDFDRWDLQADCGLLGGARLLSTIEEHGGGKQYLRVRVHPRVTWTTIILSSALAVLSLLAALDAAMVASVILGGMAFMLAFRSFIECGKATYSIHLAVEKWRNGSKA